MWLEAILSHEDLRQLAAQLFPLTFDLGGGATLLLATPSEVSLVPDAGLRIVCSAELTWPVLGIAVPISLRSLSLVLSPKIAQKDGAEVLAFEPTLEHADFVMVPGAVDDRLSARINQELLKHKTDVAWNFAETLRGSFELPDALSPRGAVTLCSHGAMVRVTAEAVVLAVSMQATISHDGAVAK